VDSILRGILIATISGILVWFFRKFFPKFFKFFRNKFGQWRLNQSKQKLAKQKLSLSEEFKNKLRLIVDGFSDCLDYRKTCSLRYLIGDIQRLYSSQPRTLANLINESNIEKVLKRAQKENSLSFLIDEADLLWNWYKFYKNRINSVTPSYLPELFNEFGFILIRTLRIFEKTMGVLKTAVEIFNKDYIGEFKMNQYGYPLFKQIFSTTTNEFSKLTQEAAQKLQGIRTWSVMALPEL
jgi:hypothetical protein